MSSRDSGWSASPLVLPKHSGAISEFVRFAEQRLMGQDLAIERLAYCLESNEAGLRPLREHHPLFMLLFLGPTGVGKTELARVLSEYWYGSTDALSRLDCSEFMERHAAEGLIGSPPGYVAHNEEPRLSQRRIEKPAIKPALFGSHRHEFEALLKRDLKVLREEGFSLVNDPETGLLFKGRVLVDVMMNTRMGPMPDRRRVDAEMTIDEVIDGCVRHAYSEGIGSPYRTIMLWDEIDKAHVALYNYLLQISEEGVLTMRSSGEENDWPRVTNFENCGIILTSNHGGKKIQSAVRGNKGIGVYAADDQQQGHRVLDEEIYRIGKKAAEEAIVGELRGRIGKDGLIVFRPLEPKHFEQILELQIQYFIDTLKAAGFPLELDLTDVAREFLVTKGSSSEYGARHLKTVFQKYAKRKIEIGKNDGLIFPGDAVRFDISDKGGDLDIIVTSRDKGFVVEIAEEKSPFHDFIINAWADIEAKEAQAKEPRTPPSDRSPSNEERPRIPTRDRSRRQ